MGEESTPESLLARIAQRDEAALGELYDRAGPALLGMVRRILPDRDGAAQVVEDAFLHLWQEARHFPHQDASAVAWLVIRARNMAIVRRRAQRKLPKLAPLPAAALQESFSWLPRPEEIKRLGQRRELLKKIVNQLSKSQRMALDLTVFEGCTEAEIAAKLEQPLGRVQAGLRAAMRFLRHRLRAVLGTWAANI